MNKFKIGDLVNWSQDNIIRIGHIISFSQKDGDTICVVKDDTGTNFDVHYRDLSLFITV